MSIRHEAGESVRLTSGSSIQGDANEGLISGSGRGGMTCSSPAVNDELNPCPGA
jgi:hypothetical protein